MGVKEKATHPPFVPPIKGGIIFVKEIQAIFPPPRRGRVRVGVIIN